MDDAVNVMVWNGWAASEHAWDLCGFMRTPSAYGRLPVIYSYIDQLDGKPERAFEDGGRFAVVGWSMGGSSALRLACMFPEQIAGLVLVAATPRMMEDGETGWKGMSNLRLSALRRGLELTHGQGLFGMPDGRPNPYIEDSPENLDRGIGYLLETDVRADLERVFGGGCAFPVHVIQSEHDGIVRKANAEYLKRVFPDAAVNIISGGEHALPVSVPDIISSAVASIVNRVSQTSQIQ